MYQVMIADDESLITETLQRMVCWEKYNFEVIGCYSDGSQLLEAIEYNPVDLIITDIKMNLMSGLEVAKYIHEQMPFCKVMLISGYQEFQLAVEAIQYGVIEYMPKPLNIPDVEARLEKAARLLDEQRADLHVQQEMKQKMEQMQLVMKEKLFVELVFGGVIDLAQTQKYLRMLYPAVDFCQSSCFLCELRISQYDQYIENVWMYSREQLENNLRNFFQMYDNGMIVQVVYKSREVIGLLGITLCRADDWSVQHQNLLAQLVEELQHFFRFQASFTIKKEYASLQELADKKGTGMSLDLREGQNQILLNQLKKQILSDIGEGNLNSAQSLLGTAFDELAVNDVVYIRQFVYDLLTDMMQVMKTTNQQFASEIENYIQYEKIRALSTSQQIQNYLMRILDRIKMLGAAKLHQHSESFVEQAKQYVLEHISEDISREDVAEALFICSTYLSRIFKQQTGETFNQYLTKVKVEKSIELLRNPRYKIYEICESLGYKTPRYFSNIFRSHTGMNPSEYRKSVLHLEVTEDEK